ncbi:MAG TPA: trypsin-like peptidase domain-containing protein, partial [Thermomicrobiales bacterium]|nr:trypsin-like peptidase domain-containing protein [Thermomicrobiales bacterium]
IWAREGIVLTANHVVERDEDVSVGLPSGERLPVNVRGRDLGTDIALLALNGDMGEITAATRSSVEARPGALVLALGRPSDAGIMGSFGSVSATGGAIPGVRGNDIGSLLQADVAMLPGFSGGPLIDSEGKMLGMNSSVLGGAGGLTISNRLLERIVGSLREHGRVRRGFLGIGAQSVQLPAATVSQHELGQERGLLLVAIEPGGPAEREGLLLGDVLLSIEGAQIADVDDLQSRLVGDRVGTAMAITLLRAGQVQQIAVTVGERP